MSSSLRGTCHPEEKNLASGMVCSHAKYFCISCGTRSSPVYSW